MKNQIVPLYFAGFWIRLLATLIDSALLLAILFPLMWGFFGNQIKQALSLALQQDLANPQLTLNLPHLGPGATLISYAIPIVATLIFWHYRSATPGKMLLSLEIIDVKTLEQPSTWQFILRYIAYIISTIPLFLGFIWIAFDPHKQAWHDKIADTYVVQRKWNRKK